MEEGMEGEQDRGLGRRGGGVNVDDYACAYNLIEHMHT